MHGFRPLLVAAATLLLAACGSRTDVGEATLPVAAAASAGTLTLDRAVYSAPASANLFLEDADLNKKPGAIDTATVTVTSTTSPSGEVVTLQEAAANLGSFVGSIVVAMGAEVPSNGVLEVQPGDTIVATYRDRRDGAGRPSIVQAFAVVDAMPDLVADSVAGDSSAGSFLVVSAQLHADPGGGTVVPSTTRTYLSVDPVLDAGDTLLQQATLGELAPGAVFAWQYRAPLDTLPPGSFYVILVCDADRTIVELSEANNVAVSAAPVAIPLNPPPPPPDLVEEYVSIATSGTTTTITDRVAADAASSAPGDFVVRVYLTPEVPGYNAVLVAERVVSGLKPGQTSTATTVVPAGLVPLGLYYAYVVADATNAVAEWNETNNARQSTMKALVH